MNHAKLAVVLLTTALAPEAIGAPPQLPWKGNRPSWEVRKEVYQRHPSKGVGAWVTVRYVGPELEREEVHTTWSRSDTPEMPKRRWSHDNGRKWSGFEPMPDVVTHPQGVRVFWGRGPQLYDPVGKVTVSIWLHQPHLRGRHHNHCFVRVSHDEGRTWGEPALLRYEAGDAFDPDNPFRESFLAHNQAYFGSNILPHTGGTLIHCVAHANAPGDPENDERPWRMGSLCFVGKWSGESGGYQWTAGRRVEISPGVSSRGLMEPAIAELDDGRVLVIWRGSDTPSTPGRKWFSVSTDGGLTLGRVQELKYDDGTQFYSPSSIHRMIRHTVTGKLYWVGNISAVPPRGNSPRYPLVIAEVDERIPALKRSTVTAIDDRRPGESERLQLSNFSLLENRETHALEVYLTRIGADPEDFWGADAYKYTLTLK
jgi:hypothetical protein